MSFHSKFSLETLHPHQKRLLGEKGKERGRKLLLPWKHPSTEIYCFVSFPGNFCQSALPLCMLNYEVNLLIL